LIKSIAIGSFDGVHIAHQELIKEADAVLVIERGFATLTPGWKRSIYTKKATFFYMLDKIKALSPKEFIEQLKRDFPALEKIVVGYDFAFGKEKSGDTKTLKELFDGEVKVVDEVKLNGISVHSRVIRDLIKNSNIELANSMLGRAYAIEGEHIRGLGLGSKELVPTINLSVKNYTLPNGVFACRATVENRKFNAICFVGHRESVDDSFTLEVHILDDFNIDIKSRVWVEFISFIRESQKFSSLAELKKQIFKDIAIAKESLKI